MLTHPTLDKLRQFGLAGMARAFEDLAANARGGELAPAEWIGLLLVRALFQKLALGGWIEAWENLIIEGSTGVGKSWLTCALGQKAYRDNHSVPYQRVLRLSPISAWPAAMAGMPGRSAPSVR